MATRFSSPSHLIKAVVALSLIMLSFAALADRPVILPVHDVPLQIQNAAGEILSSFSVEIAATPAQRATGLMHRENYGGDNAMLFDFGMSRLIAMWMKNTPSSLDMIFAGPDGLILAIVPNTTAFSTAIIQPQVLSHYVLEIGAGEAIKRNIAEGDYLRHPTIPVQIP